MGYCGCKVVVWEKLVLWGEVGPALGASGEAFEAGEAKAMTAGGAVRQDHDVQADGTGNVD